MALKESLEEVLKDLRQTQKRLRKFSKDMPDQDAYAYAYSIAKQTVDKLETCIKELGPATKEAIKEAKKNPDQPPNRAIQWM